MTLVHNKFCRGVGQIRIYLIKIPKDHNSWQGICQNQNKNPLYSEISLYSASITLPSHLWPHNFEVPMSISYMFLFVSLPWFIAKTIENTKIWLKKLLQWVKVLMHIEWQKSRCLINLPHRLELDMYLCHDKHMLNSCKIKIKVLLVNQNIMFINKYFYNSW